jgi:hypothetical protein
VSAKLNGDTMRAASVAKVAMVYGINADVMHRWRQLVLGGSQATVAKPSGLIPVAIAAPLPTASCRDIEVELRRVDARDAAVIRTHDLD